MMIIRRASITRSPVACTLILGLSVGAGAQEAATTDAKPGTASAAGAGQAKTCKVEAGTFRIETTLKGIIEPQSAVEVSLKPEAWTMPLTVEKAIEHGSGVKKGDILLELDTDRIDQAIKDLRTERSLGEAALRHADEELPILEKLLPLDLASAERSKARADEDLARFLEHDRPLAEQSARFQVKSAQYRLESARDELAQLEKMYREKDLTEETEQLILKRHRFTVEAAQFQVRTAEENLDKALHVDLPRRDQITRDDAAKQTLALARARSLLPLEVNQKRLARDKLRFEAEKNDEKLAKLERDRKAMTVRAPADGIVYYGKLVDGKWAPAGAAAQKLQRGGVLPPAEGFMVIMAPRPASIRAGVDEKDLHALRPSMEGKAVPTGYPDLKLPARLASVSAVPLAPGNFDVRVDVDLSQGAEMLMPGMACTVTFLSYRKEDALTVPAAAVQNGETDEDVRYVYLAGKGGNGKPRKQVVRIGKAGGGKVEILDGLKEGDEILSAKP